MEGVPRVGQLVISRAGRDAGRALVVVGLCDERHVLVADGRLRPVARPKRKNVRHLAYGAALHAGLSAGKSVGDAEMRAWLTEVAGGERVAGPGAGREEVQA